MHGKEQIRLLLMGPNINIKSPEIASGPIVFFDGLKKELTVKEVDFIVIDTNKKNYMNFIFAYISIVFQVILKQVDRTHIALHSSRDYMILGALIIFVGRFFGKKISLRKFGGEAIRTYESSNGLKKIYLQWLFSEMDTLFFQTRYLVDFFLGLNAKTYWFPNVRKKVLRPSIPREFKKRFVFISHVIREKGIDEIIEAFVQLDKTYSIDIYGPILDRKYSEEYFQKHGISYKGALEAVKVVETLNKYDVVLLPSYKEGYPGIVIEAYSLGMPVITTNLQAIKEIVDPYKTGVLIEPKDVKGLIGAIRYFDIDNYAHMSVKAYKKFDLFEFDTQTIQYLERLKV